MEGVCHPSLPRSLRAVVVERAVEGLEGLAERTRPSLFALPGLCLAALVLADLRRPEIAVLLGAGLLGTALSLRRCALVERGSAPMRAAPAAWRQRFGRLALGPVLVASLAVALEVSLRGLDLVAIALVAAWSIVGAGASHAFAPDHRLLRLNALARIPVVVALVAASTRATPLGWLVAAALAILTASELVVGRRLNHEFWLGVATNALLERQTDALFTKSDALEAATDALRKHMLERERLAVELRLTHKLEAVGRLAGGIAHEINTPLQAVGTNVTFVMQAVADLRGLVTAYRDIVHRVEGDGAERLRQACLDAEHEADGVYLLDHLPEALTQSLESLECIAGIVRSVRELARTDAEDMEWLDVNALLETMLRLVRASCEGLTVETAWGDLPHVRCNAAEVSQAFLGLVTNAAQALVAQRRQGGRTSADAGRIGICTRRDGAEIVVSVSDDGPGIAPEVRHRVFDPFFTTKDVGQGMGQGLAVAHAAIVNRHGGRLTFETELGRGTTFFLRLPIAGKTADAQSTSPSTAASARVSTMLSSMEQ